VLEHAANYTTGIEVTIGIIFSKITSESVLLAKVE